MDNNFSWGLEVDYIAHYGVPHGHGPNGGSGRYPWGSGAKWGKTPLGKATDRIKKFFGKNRIEKSNAEREISTPPEDKYNKYSIDELRKLHDSTSFGEKIHIYENLMNRSYKNGDVEAAKLFKELTKTDIEDYGTDFKSKLPEQKSAESHEANRKAALESGDRNQILKYFSESSNEELQRAINKAGMMDSLNKSINDAKPKTQSAEELTKAQRETYVREALGSGDINRILSVAMDPSVNNNDLTNAINKMNTMNSLAKQAQGPTSLEKAVATVDRIKAGLDKTLGYYDTASKVWNTVAGNYNTSNAVKTGQSKPLGYLMPTPNLKQDNNQKKDEKKNDKSQNNQQNQQSQKNELAPNIKAAMGSGNLETILKFSSHPDVTDKILNESINKANTISKLSEQVQREAMEKLKNKEIPYDESLFPNWDGFSK